MLMKVLFSIFLFAGCISILYGISSDLEWPYLLGGLFFFAIFVLVNVYPEKEENHDSLMRR